MLRSLALALVLTLPLNAEELLIEGSAFVGAPVPKHAVPKDAVPRDAVARLFSWPSLAESAKFHDEGRLGPEAVASAKVGADGFFELKAPAAGLWRVVVEAPGREPVEQALAPLIDPSVLASAELAEARYVDLEVLGADGKKLDGAWVAVVSPQKPDGGRRFSPAWLKPWQPLLERARTDAAGRARLARPKEPHDVWIVAPGHAPKRVAIAGERQTVKLEVGRSVVIEARDPGGRAVAGALVGAAELPFLLARTDSAGRAVLHVAADDQTKLEVSTAEFFFSGRPPSAASWRVDLAAIPSYSGRVLDDSALRPIPKAKILVAGDGPSLVETGPDGSFSLRTRQTIVFVEKAGYELGQAQLRPEVTISLKPAARLEGRAVDAAGQGLAHVELALEVAQKGRMFRNVVIGFGKLLSRRDGRFVVPRAVLESHELRGTKRGLAPAFLKLDQLQAFETRRDLKLVLGPGRRAFGWVVDGEGLPIASATAALVKSEAGQPFLPGRRALHGFDPFAPAAVQAESDKSGRFEIELGDSGTFSLEVQALGFAPTTIVGLEIADDQKLVELGKVTLVPGSSLKGRVIDEAGQVVMGAEVFAVDGSSPMSASFAESQVEALPATAVSAADGSFAVADLQAGIATHLVVKHPSFVATTLPGLQAPQESLEVKLIAAGTLAGRVVDSDGRPIAEAMVNAQVEGQRMVRPTLVTTDSEGRFRLNQVRPGILAVSATARGFQTFRLGGMELRGGQEIADLELVLEPAGTVQGRVLDGAGKPVRAFVSLGDGSAFGDRGGNMTDDAGFFSIEDAVPGLRVISARSLDQTQKRVSKNLEVKLGTQTIDLILDSGTRVAGRVISEDGAPIASAEVAVDQGSRSESRPDGSFELHLKPGSYTLGASHANFAPNELPAKLEVGQEPLEGLEIVLGAGATIQGRLIGLSLEDMSRVMIELRSAAGRAGRRVSYSSDRSFKARFDGRYQLDHVPPGEHIVVATLPGALAQAKVTVAANVPVIEQDLDFTSGLTLSGLVTRDEIPVVDLMIWVRNDAQGFFANTQTDTAGRFSLSNLQPGDYDVELRDRWTGFYQSRPVSLTRDFELEVKLESARLSGIVLDSQRQGLADVRVSLLESSDPKRPQQLHATTDHQGRFRFAKAHPGRLELRATKVGYVEVANTFELAAGEDKSDLELILLPAASLTVKVRTAAGVEPEMINACFVADGGQVSSCQHLTPVEGQVRIETLAPGGYTMVLTDSQAPSVELRVAVPGEAGPVVLPRGGLVKVRVPELENSAEETKVRIIDALGRAYRSARWGHLLEEWPLSNGQIAVKLPAGSWTIEVKTAGGRSFSGQALVVEGGELTVELN